MSDLQVISPNISVTKYLISIDGDDRFPVSGRALHGSLKIDTPYHKWFPRQCEYGFVEGTDFWTKMSESTGGRPGVDHNMTISMAKEICMLQRTEQGRQTRRYLIEIEEQWNQPDAVIARARIGQEGSPELSLEDASRGLGFTETKGDKQYVMWRRVIGYLNSFGISAEAGGATI